MDSTGRKCITLKQSNIDYVENLVGKEKYKNFSHAIDCVLDGNRLETNLNKHLSKEEIDENVSFVKVAELVKKCFKKEREV